MMSEVTQAIASAGPRNAQLLSVLAESDYAPAALKQQKAYIADVEATIKRKDNDIKKLEASTKKELKDHEKFRDSHVKRLAYKLGGKKEKFDEKASKEEREYFEAVIAQKAAEDERVMLREQLKDAQRVKGELEGTAETHRQAQEELDELYNSIFAGPTPEFPEEDAKEFPVYDAEKRRGDLQTKLSAGAQALQSLTNAEKLMRASLGEMGEALNWSTWDVFGGGGLSDFMERNALSAASSAAQRAVALVDQARRLDSNVRSIPPVDIANGNIWSDVVFDNIFTDLHFHEKIKQSTLDVQRAAAQVSEQKKLAGQRNDALNREITQAETDLMDARKALQKVRQEAFEKVAASHPPEYSG